MDSTRLELFKNKEEHAQSANASQEVRKHLAGFIRSKQLQGSGTQLDNSTNTTTTSNQAFNSGGNISAASSYQPNRVNSTSGGNNSSNNNSNPAGQEFRHHPVDSMAVDDHPLRKTASMPTMHIPYKAQSLSRRRQMERRTTMSPLMRRKSKSRRQLLGSQDSNSTEHLSSNPCMNQNHHHHHLHHHPSDARSLSQSNSPPPPGAQSVAPFYYNNQHQKSSIQPAQSSNIAVNDIGGVSNFTGQSQQAYVQQQQQQLKVAVAESPETPSKLTNLFNNIRELENLRNSLGDSSYFSSSTGAGTRSSSNSQPQQISPNQQQQQLQISSSNILYQHMSTSNSTSVKDNYASQYQSSTSSSPLNRDNLDNSSNQLMRQQQQQQQHMKVSEAIKRMQRISSRGKVTIGGSLDIDAPPSSVTMASGSRAFGGSSRRGNNMASYKDELRQRSLDGADLRTNGLLTRLQQAGGGDPSLTPAAPGNLFIRDIYKLRMATTNDAASLRRSQSPSASIITGGHQPSPAQYQLQQQHRGQLHGKLYSSSSSSTSSLLSQQDSLDDSSSQAIDLSSSSEANRSRHHHHQQQHQHYQQQAGQISSSSSSYAGGKGLGQINNASGGQQAGVSQHYQMALQESFTNQLQLSQGNNSGSNNNNYKQFLNNPPTQHQQQADVGQNHPTSLLDASRTATSLDGRPNVNLFATLADQFNLSASAQSIILAQVESQLACLNSSSMVVDQPTPPQNPPSATSASNQPSQTVRDHHQWLIAYNNLLQSSTNELQQANQVIGSLLDKIPEPYRSNIWSQSSVYNQQLQLRQQHQRQLQAALAAGAGCRETSALHYNLHDDHRSHLINRTLSSPLLMSSASAGSGKQDCQPLPPPSQSQQLSGINRMAEQRDRSQQATVMMQLDTLQLTDKEKKLQAAAGSSMLTDTSSGGDNNSIDLTLSSRSSGPATASDDGGVGAVKQKPRLESAARHQVVPPSQHHHHHQQQQTLHFNYTPLDPERALTSFIYNPVFDDSSSTGLVYELEMCNHKCICANENNHPENSQRILAIWRRLYDKGLMAKCARIHSRKASFDEIQLCHSETYSYYFGKSPYERIKINKLDLSKLPIEGLTQLECGGQGTDIDTAWNEEQTPGVARLAAGCVIEAALSVAKGKLMNAFAIVRPPGHHAEFQQAMGFCFFNSVAIAARVLIARRQLAKLLIVDWDVHHGNGIQKVFYHDNSVMYISLHRHDKGNFFPGTGDSREIGTGAGEGYNWNIAWSSATMGDAEYVAAFRSIVMPIAREFNPSMVLVACGFDAAHGHPFNFGGYDLSAACFAYMTRQLMTLANGRLVLCLEGGYQITAICDCAESCLRALLSEPLGEFLPRESELRREPNHSAREALYEVSNLAAKYWPSVEKWRHTIEMSAAEAANSLGSA